MNEKKKNDNRSGTEQLTDDSSVILSEDVELEKAEKFIDELDREASRKQLKELLKNNP